MNPHHSPQSSIENPKSKIFNPWPIALTLIIATAFAGAVFVAVTMIRQSVDLVRPDYYEQDLIHEQRMDQERRARGLEAPLRIAYEASANTIALTFPAADTTGTIQLYRPSDSALDHHLDIALDAAGSQVIDASALVSGLWRVQVSWRQGGEDYYAAESVIIP